MSAAEFTQKVGGTVNQGFIATGIALGTRLGLFKALADLAQSKEAAVTTQQLADSIHYKERYVREWINGMVCGGIIDHEEIDGTDRYWLEPYRLPALLGDHLQQPAIFTELLVVGMEGFKLVEKCFPVDGPSGTAVDDYPGLHEWLARRNIHWLSPDNCSIILADDPELIGKLEKGIKVLEMGGGACQPTKALATSFPKSTFVATDLSPSNVEAAKANVKGLSNVECQVLDACDVPNDMQEQFDLIMLFDVYHDVPHPQKLVDGAVKLLKKGGQFLMNDIAMHERLTDNKNSGAAGGLYYTISTLYCVPTSLNTPGGEGLGACGGQELYERRLKKSFVEVKKIAKDFGLHFLCTK